LEWACSEVAILLYQNKNQVGADRVGRLLRAEGSAYGGLFRVCYQRFDTAGREAHQTHHPAQQWSWLRTLLNYKLNPMRAASNNTLFEWVPVQGGVEIHLVDPRPTAPVSASAEPSSSSSGVPDYTSDPATFRPVPTVWPDHRAAKARRLDAAPAGAKPKSGAP